jgi:predicted metal-dependent hydrolase
MTRRERRQEFKSRVGAWAARVRVNPAQVRVQQMTRKWASCSARGWCTFASDLLEEGHAFQDYVIVHELLHLKIRNHGRVFKSLLTAHMPSWRRFCPNGLGTSCVVRKEDS